jgi:hypothetical protein
MPYPSTRCPQPTLNWLYGRFRVGRPQCGQPPAAFYAHGYPKLYASTSAPSPCPRFPQAQDTCVAYGSNLVAIETEAENTYITQFIERVSEKKS